MNVESTDIQRDRILLPSQDRMHRSRLTLKTASSKKVALLLMQVRLIALNEVRSESPDLAQTVSSPTMCKEGRPLERDSVEEFGGHVCVTSPIRFRTISVCSMDSPRQQEFPTISPCSSYDAVPVSPDAGPQPSPPVLDEKEFKIQLDSVVVPRWNVSNVVGRKWVGTQTNVPCRGVLQPKFSWKSFPELEEYLVQHRSEYLQCSSSLNYTAEQKRYNNRLTQGLLDLAAEKGYIFEGFTFAAVRDRIRCYFKSYVQAAKKKKRKKKRK